MQRIRSNIIMNWAHAESRLCKAPFFDEQSLNFVHNTSITMLYSVQNYRIRTLGWLLWASEIWQDSTFTRFNMNFLQCICLQWLYGFLLDLCISFNLNVRVCFAITGARHSHNITKCKQYTYVLGYLYCVYLSSLSNQNYRHLATELIRLSGSVHRCLFRFIGVYLRVTWLKLNSSRIFITIVSPAW